MYKGKTPASITLALCIACSGSAAGAAEKAFFAEPQVGTWTQDNWSGGEADLITTDDDIDTYYLGEYVSTPPSLITAGLYGVPLGIDSTTEPVSIKDCDLSFYNEGILLAVGSLKTDAGPSGRLYWALVDDLSDDPYAAWTRSDELPLAFGRRVVSLDSIEVTYDGWVYVGGRASGDFAVEYEFRIEDLSYTSTWRFLEGPGNPSDTPPTYTCYDIYAPYKLSTFVLTATGDGGSIFNYEGPPTTGFEQVYLGDDVEDVYRIYEAGPGLLNALTGHHGGIYRSLIGYPDSWEPLGEDETRGIESNDLYDFFSFGNYDYLAAGDYATIYKSNPSSEPDVPAWEEPDLITGDCEAVYSLGHAGNLLIAGTGPDGGLLVSYDGGEVWAKTHAWGPGNKIRMIYDLGTEAPLAAVVAVDGTNGGLFLVTIAAVATLESRALDIAVITGSEEQDTAFGSVTWSADLNGGEVWVAVRTFNDADASDALSWEYVERFDGNIEEADRLTGVNRGDRYLQYKATLIPSSAGETPFFDWIKLDYRTLGFDSLLPDDHVFAYPNPVTEVICEFHYNLSEDAAVTAEVYDLKGRLVWSAEENGLALRPGQYFEWDTSYVAPDVYLFRVTAATATGETDSVIKKVAVLK